MTMKKITMFRFVLCSLCLFCLPALAKGALVRVSGHIYSYLDVQNASAANSFGANSGIVIGDKGVAVVDTLISAKEAKRFIADIRAVTDKPILYAINTHEHLDHSFGNSEFKALGATIIAQSEAAATMHKHAENTLKNAASFGLTPEDMAGTEIAYPTVTFKDRQELDLGGVKVVLIHPHPSHTIGSIMVHIPADKVVFSGDILFTNFHPYMGDGDIVQWRMALDDLAELGPEKIIPGHGPLSTVRDLADMKAYLTKFDTLAREMIANHGRKPIESLVEEMTRSLPKRAQGEWLIRANMEIKYLPKKETQPAGK
jgi:cyclase